MSDNKQHTVTNKYKNEKKEKLTHEQKAAKFKKLAMARGNRAVKYIELIGNLSSSNYVYNEEQVKAIFNAIHEAAHDIESRFVAKKKIEKLRIQL